MPGQISRPPNMRDVIYRWNFKVGYACAAFSVVSFAAGAAWVIFKRDRYDRAFEKIRDPEYKKLIMERTKLRPDKYAAYIKEVQEYMADIRAKHEAK